MAPAPMQGDTTDANGAAGLPKGLLQSQAEAGSRADRATGAAPAYLRNCRKDSDCVAVDRVGCCHNGWKEAVAVTAKEAYADSFTCPEQSPICPMYLVRDLRVPECDSTSPASPESGRNADPGRGQCIMVAPSEIACGGSRANARACPSGYRCRPSTTAGDGSGKCESTSLPVGSP
jgi:hypothetical protein